MITKCYKKASCTFKPTRIGLSRIDCLVVIGVISLLFQVALLAVQYSRSQARHTQCLENLRQIAQGILKHVEFQECYPSSGWGDAWIGEPERGMGIDQPGSWIYNILPYIGHQDLRDQGLHLPASERDRAMRERCVKQLDLFICPGRGLPPPPEYPLVKKTYTQNRLFQQTVVTGAKSDYAACSGNAYIAPDRYMRRACFSDFEWQPPTNLNQGDAESFVWPTDDGFLDKHKYPVFWTGVIYGRSQTTQEDIVDGTSRTYLIGEKAVHSQTYHARSDTSDDENMYVGFSEETCRITGERPFFDKPRVRRSAFGTSHPLVWHVAYADGSVHQVSPQITEQAYRSMADRYDFEAAAKQLLDETANTQKFN